MYDSLQYGTGQFSLCSVKSGFDYFSDKFYRYQTSVWMKKRNEQDRGGSYWVFGHAGIHKRDQDKRKFWIIKALTNLFSKYAKKRSGRQL